MRIAMEKRERRKRRHHRVRARVSGTAKRPRLSVFKSNRDISAQLIDDVSHRVMLGAVARKLTGVEENAGNRAHALGKHIAQAAKKAGITSAVFDRGGYRYAGNVKALADGAREGGLSF